LSFFAYYTDSNVGSLDHGDIVCSVTNGKHSLGWMLFFDKINDIGLFFGSNTTSEDDIKVVGNNVKSLLSILISLDHT
jgi:hypothetical protein